MTLARELWPLNRSLTGAGVRQTLAILQKYNKSLKILKFKTGTKVFDWTIPKEWFVKNAWIKDYKNKKIVDFKKNNLHLVGYSFPIKKTFILEKIKKNLHFHKNQPNAIPYLTSYYSKNWGFCLSYNQFKKLKKKDRLSVFIDSGFKKGFLTGLYAIAWVFNPYNTIPIAV